MKIKTKEEAREWLLNFAELSGYRNEYEAAEEVLRHCLGFTQLELAWAEEILKELDSEVVSEQN